MDKEVLDYLHQNTEKSSYHRIVQKLIQSIILKRGSVKLKLVIVGVLGTDGNF